LKAYLIFKEITFPKTHDLPALFELCREFISEFEFWRELFELLNPYSVQFRYPGEEASLEEARAAVRTIKQIRSFMSTCFPSDVWPAADS
jgi:HEPN domain-containing protein